MYTFFLPLCRHFVCVRSSPGPYSCVCCVMVQLTSNRLGAPGVTFSGVTFHFCFIRCSTPLVARPVDSCQKFGWKSLKVTRPARHGTKEYWYYFSTFLRFHPFPESEKYQERWLSFPSHPLGLAWHAARSWWSSRLSLMISSPRGRHVHFYTQNRQLCKDYWTFLSI